MSPPTTWKQVRAFLGLVGYYRKFIKGFAKIAKPLTLLTRQQVKFDWTSGTSRGLYTFEKKPLFRHQSSTTLFQTKPTSYTQMLLTMPVGAQLSQEHDGTKFPVAFLSHTFSETQHKWSTTEQEAFGVYYAITQMELLPARSQYNCLE